MMFQIKAKVIKNIEVAQRYYKILLSCAPIARLAKPGQFVEVKASENYEPLLRRPFSIHQVRDSNIEILYEIVGPGTEILSQKKAGEYLDIIGPLGNGFSILDTRSLILVAGGMGVAPLLFLAEKVSIQHPASSIQVLIGARTKNKILCSEGFKASGCEVRIATDDGAKGFKGKVTDLLNKVLSSIQYPCLSDRQAASSIYACGPKPMLKEVAAVSTRYKIPAQISLEEHMACGIGACLGCVVKLKTQNSKVKSAFEYKRVCKEGPVFDAQEIIW